MKIERPDNMKMPYYSPKKYNDVYDRNLLQSKNRQNHGVMKL